MFYIGLFFLFSAFTTNNEIGTVWSGKASYYHNSLHGLQTANGERYNKNEFTAAHKTLPFNTYVKVTNLKTSKSVVVRINDRGPFVKGRDIDLSYAAARAVGLVKPGVAKCRLEIIDFSRYNQADVEHKFPYNLIRSVF